MFFRYIFLRTAENDDAQQDAAMQRMRDAKTASKLIKSSNGNWVVWQSVSQWIDCSVWTGKVRKGRAKSPKRAQSADYDDDDVDDYVVDDAGPPFIEMCVRQTTRFIR